MNANPHTSQTKSLWETWETRISGHLVQSSLCFDWQKVNKSSNRWLQGCFSLTQQVTLVQTAQQDLTFTYVNHLCQVWYWSSSYMIYSKFHIDIKRKGMLHVFAALNYFIVQAQTSIVVGKKKVKWYTNNNNQVLLHTWRVFSNWPSLKLPLFLLLGHAVIIPL